MTHLLFTDTLDAFPANSWRPPSKPPAWTRTNSRHAHVVSRLGDGSPGSNGQARSATTRRSLDAQCPAVCQPSRSLRAICTAHAESAGTTPAMRSEACPKPGGSISPSRAPRVQLHSPPHLREGRYSASKRRLEPDLSTLACGVMRPRHPKQSKPNVLRGEHHMTSSDFLEKTVIPHLRDQLKQAAVVLFTGAGFSASTKNLSGETLPTAQGLSHSLWAIAYPSRDPDPRSSLPDIYEAALNTRPKEVERVVRTALTVDSQSIADWILLYYSRPWHKAYTLNIDSLVSALNQRRELPRELVPVSAMSDSPTKDYPPDRFLKVVHLNGVLDDLPHNVTFSHTQYAQRLAEPDRTYQELSAEIVGRPFIFAGTNLEESPLWQSIERRLSKGATRLQGEPASLVPGYAAFRSGKARST